MGGACPGPGASPTTAPHTHPGARRLAPPSASQGSGPCGRAVCCNGTRRKASKSHAAPGDRENAYVVLALPNPDQWERLSHTVRKINYVTADKMSNKKFENFVDS